MINYLPIEKDIEGLKQVMQKIQAIGGVADSFSANVASHLEMDNLVAKTLERFGGWIFWLTRRGHQPSVSQALRGFMERRN
jgi:hypothetical protein